MDSPADVKGLNENQARQLCAELRDFLVREVSRTGGHLASNLGVVELTVAIHRVFDTSVDRLVFDVGHQCYVHKALTGRRELFDTLRQFGGLSGFPKPWESVPTRLSPVMPPTPCRWPWAWPGPGPCRGRTIMCWP